MPIYNIVQGVKEKNATGNSSGWLISSAAWLSILGLPIITWLYMYIVSGGDIAEYNRIAEQKGWNQYHKKQKKINEEYNEEKRKEKEETRAKMRPENRKRNIENEQIAEYRNKKYQEEMTRDWEEMQQEKKKREIEYKEKKKKREEEERRAILEEMQANQMQSTNASNSYKIKKHSVRHKHKKISSI